MLLNDFFRIESLQQDLTTVRATLRLDAEHPIFKGHFPGRPVVPGACMLQLVQEMTSLVTGKECRLLKGDQIKFISMIDPGANPALELTLTVRKDTADDWLVSAELTGTAANMAALAVEHPAPIIFFKFKGTFRSA